MKRFNLVLSILFTVMFLAACGNSSSSTNSSHTSSTEQEKYVLKTAHLFNTESYPHKYVEWFDEEIQKRSNGRLALEIYPNGQLVPGDQEIPAMLQGQIDMVHSTAPVLTGFDPLWNVYMLPFLFGYDPKNPNVLLENRSRFNNSENGGGKIRKSMEEKGVKVLAMDYVDLHASIFTTDEDNMVTDLESVKGLKLRTSSGKINTSSVEVLGASSMSIIGPELITALQQGVVDGMLSTPLYVRDAKLPVKTATVVPMYDTPTPLVMSLSKFNSLPKDLQDILVQTGKDLEKHATEVLGEEGLSIYKTLEDRGIKMYYPTEQEIMEWKEALKPVREMFVKEVKGGTELLEEASKLD